MKLLGLLFYAISLTGQLNAQEFSAKSVYDFLDQSERVWSVSLNKDINDIDTHFDLNNQEMKVTGDIHYTKLAFTMNDDPAFRQELSQRMLELGYKKKQLKDNHDNLTFFTKENQTHITEIHFFNEDDDSSVVLLSIIGNLEINKKR